MFPALMKTAQLSKEPNVPGFLLRWKMPMQGGTSLWACLSSLEESNDDVQGKAIAPCVLGPAEILAPKQVIC